MSRTTQRAAILRLLVEAKGSWVPLPEIMACAAQYNARIFELRGQGFNIENRSETTGDGTRHSWFRLVDSPGHQSAPEPPKSATDWHARPRATGLELFDGAVRP